MRWLILACSAASIVFSIAACGGEIRDQAGPQQGGAGGQSGGNGGGPDDESFPLACDPLVPTYCGYPFPSNVYAVEDASTPTGLRVAFKARGLPRADDGHVQDPAPWSKNDGFSASGTILTQLPNATSTGLPGVLDIDASLADDSPTIIMDAETGERVPHWSEIDKSVDFDQNPSLLIHPAVPLQDGTRYIVAIRNVVDASGSVVPPTAAFLSLREDLMTTHPSIDARRDLYNDIFSRLEAEGIARQDLQLAWDFTTASRENITGPLLHMREEADSLVGPAGAPYMITSIDTTLDPANIMFRVRGTMEVPLYLSSTEPGGTLVLGDDGLPEPNPAMPTYDVEWELLIPNSAAAEPAKLLQNGHGLFGSELEIEDQHFREFCNTFGYAIFGTKVIGMSSLDRAWVAERLSLGELDELNKLYDRIHQGILNNLLLMRVMSQGLANDPMLGQYLRSDFRNFWGISQGGITGAVTSSLSTDIQSSVLEVMGQPFNLLLNRSSNFGLLLALASTQFPDSRQQQHMQALLQMSWDRVEPSGYTKYTFTDPLPGAPSRILLRAAVGDHQVSTFGAHVMARAMGALHLDTKIRDIYGLTKVETQTVDTDGAVYTEYAFGLPPEPTCNKPQISCEDPHDILRTLDEAHWQSYFFFVTGVAENRCAGQSCNFPALGGCTGNEDQDLCD